MKATYKFIVHHAIQSVTVYVKASGVQQAIEHLERTYNGSKVEFVTLVENGHFFDIEI
jgi:hypothetical protein